MNKIISIAIFILLFTKTASGQQGANLTATQFANKIAQRMQDSLSLTNNEKGQVYSINMNLSNQKSAVWSTYNNRDSIQTHLQSIEHSRDALYRIVLTEDKYQLYLQKKNYLLNNN